MLKYSNPFWHLRNTGNATHARSAPGVYKRRRTNWAGTRYGGMPPRMRGIYRRSGYWRRDGRTSGGSVEMKFFDKQQTQTAINLAGGVVVGVGLPEGGGVFAGLTQGTGEQMRIGRKVIAKSLYVRGHIQLLPNVGVVTVQANQMLRVMLIEDRQCNGAEATTADMFETVPGGGHLFNQMNNLANKNRFKTHLDKTISLRFADASVSGGFYYQQGCVVPFKIYKKLNLPVEFSGTGVSTISNLQSANMFFYIQALNIDANIIFDCVSRVRFVG